MNVATRKTEETAVVSPTNYHLLPIVFFVTSCRTRHFSKYSLVFAFGTPQNLRELFAISKKLRDFFEIKNNLVSNYSEISNLARIGKKKFKNILTKKYIYKNVSNAKTKGCSFLQF